MEDQLSFNMPEDYFCQLWDENEGVRRAVHKWNQNIRWTNGGQMQGEPEPILWSGSSLAPDIYMRALHPD